MLPLDVGVEKNALVYSEEGGFEVSHNHALGGLIRNLEVSLIPLIVQPQKPVLDDMWGARVLFPGALSVEVRV